MVSIRFGFKTVAPSSVATSEISSPSVATSTLTRWSHSAHRSSQSALAPLLSTSTPTTYPGLPVSAQPVSAAATERCRTVWRHRPTRVTQSQARLATTTRIQVRQTPPVVPILGQIVEVRHLRYPQCPQWCLMGIVIRQLPLSISLDWRDPSTCTRGSICCRNRWRNFDWSLHFWIMCANAEGVRVCVLTNWQLWCQELNRDKEHIGVCGVLRTKIYADDIEGYARCFHCLCSSLSVLSIVL